MERRNKYWIIVMDGDKEITNIKASAFILAADCDEGVNVGMAGVLRDLLALTKHIDLSLMADQLKTEITKKMFSWYNL